MIHLHLHTEHSYLDGIPTLDQLVDRVVELNQGAVAITDHGEVSGHVRFQKAAQAKDIKPLFGIETYFAPDRRDRTKTSEREAQGILGEPYEHMTLIAKTNEGLRNLWILSSKAYTEGFYKKPRIDWELLRSYKRGIIATTGCLNGIVAACLAEGGKKYNPDLAMSRIGELLQIFGQDLYAEIHTFDSTQQRRTNNEIVDMANVFGIPLLAVSDAHYLRSEDWEDHELLTAAQMGKKFDDPSRYQYGPGQLYVMGEADVRERLAYLGDSVVSESIANTQIVADACDVAIVPSETKPVYFDNTTTDTNRLIKMAMERLETISDRMELDQRKRDAYKVRLIDELELIVEKGFAGYFLIVEDMVRWAKEQGILVGPSRGSVGGSLLAFVLGITEIDPMRGELLFGRFLDPGRTSLPDIDLDFPKDRRDEVRAYLESKYWVAAIGSLSTEKPKQVLRDFARVLRISMFDTEQMSKIVDQVKDLGVSQFAVSWSDVLQDKGGELKPWAEKYPRLFDLMERFNNHVRHDSVHASAVIVSKRPLLGSIPLRQRKEELRTQFDMVDSEWLGFVKLDMLGLRTLSTVEKAWRLVNERHPDDHVAWPHDWKWEWEKYYEDETVYEGMWSGKNVGIFQLGTQGLRETIKRFKPKSILDLTMLISIFRPGITRAVDKETGMSLLELFLRKREGDVSVEYRHQLLEPVLQETYGQFVYQEQIMRAVGVLAGFSLEEQDTVRKILGKDKYGKMKQMREDFVKRCEDLSEDTANVVFDDMEMFGVYAFGKAHAYAYAMLGWWCAWLKHYYPREFMTALFKTDEPKSVIYNREARRLGIQVLAPDITESESDFTLTEGGIIRYGLHKVKNVASSAKILEELRPYAGLWDLFNRIPKQKVNKKVMESLICVGALDSLVTMEDRRRCPPDIKGWTTSMIVLHRYYEQRGDWKIMDEQHRDEMKCTVCDGKKKLPNPEYTLWEQGDPLTSDTVEDIIDEIEVQARKLSRSKKKPKEFVKCHECEGRGKVWIESRHGDLSFFEKYCEDLNIRDVARMEETYLGTIVSIDPFQPWIETMAAEDNFPGTDDMFPGERRRMCGIITDIKPLVTQRGKNKGQAMCQFWVERPLSIQSDEDADFEPEQIVCFPKAFESYGELIEEGAPVWLRVEKLSDEGGLMLPPPDDRETLVRLDEEGRVNAAAQEGIGERYKPAAADVEVYE